MTEKLKLTEKNITELKNQVRNYEDRITELTGMINDNHSTETRIISNVLRDHGKYTKPEDMLAGIQDEIIQIIKVEASTENLPTEFKQILLETIELIVKPQTKETYATVVNKEEFTVVGKKGKTNEPKTKMTTLRK
jgi:hypothetical protein